MIRIPATVIALAVAGMSSSALAQASVTPMTPTERTYRQCTAMVRVKPEEAFESAMQWRERGGGIYARHCAALALVQLKQYAVAADRLDQVAENAQIDMPRMAPELFDQAGNAWLLADEPKRALSSFDAAIKLAPNNVDALIDRSRAKAELQDMAGARADLDRALQLSPERDDALAFRAAARRALGDAKGALADADKALAINAKNLEALLERGNLRQAAGDVVGARADWVKLIELAPGSPAADAAQAEIERFDLKK